jgi:hypothetical protein
MPGVDGSFGAGEGVGAIDDELGAEELGGAGQELRGVSGNLEDRAKVRTK